MFYVTLVRHGETPNNVAGIVQSRTDGELTERGVRMAKSLGTHLEKETYTKIFSSDLKRCRDTTANIISNLKTKVPPIQYEPLLRERDFGDWEFQDGSVVIIKVMEMGLPSYKTYQVDVPNGESYEDCKKRAGRFFSEICKLVDEAGENEENVLVVSHGCYIQCLFEFFAENSAIFELVNWNEDDLNQRPDNTCRTRFSISKSNSQNSSKRILTFTHFLDVAHLKSI